MILLTKSFMADSESGKYLAGSLQDGRALLQPRMEDAAQSLSLAGRHHPRHGGMARRLGRSFV